MTKKWINKPKNTKAGNQIQLKAYYFMCIHSQAWDSTWCLTAGKQWGMTSLKGESWGRANLGHACEWGLGKTSGSLSGHCRPPSIWRPSDSLASSLTKAPSHHAALLQSVLCYFLVLNNLFSPYPPAKRRPLHMPFPPLNVLPQLPRI